jgi:hypothetical protein
MMRHSSVICRAACAFVLCAGSMALASPSYQFTFDQSDYRVGPGEPVNVKVYLEETPGGDTSVLDANGMGMFGAGVALTNINPLPVNPSVVLAASGITPNAAFNDPTDGRRSVTASPTETAALSEVTDFSTFVHADDPTPGLTHYYMTIGTFQFTGGSTLGVTHIQTGSNPLGDVNGTADLTALDGQIGNAVATITVVPEPGMFLLSVMAGLSLLGYSCWRRRQVE